LLDILFAARASQIVAESWRASRRAAKANPTVSSSTSHLTYLAMIVDAIGSLRHVAGARPCEIKQFIRARYNVHVNVCLASSIHFAHPFVEDTIELQ
jgi:hypothetical protein